PPSDDNEESPGDVSHFDAFELLSEDDVRKLVVDSHKKSCYLDPVPTDFLVKCLDVLLPVITKIINISLETG
ncbi:RNA-directed DNA polymerase from transposon X-element, partial [Paramuricea clavata]